MAPHGTQIRSSSGMRPWLWLRTAAMKEVAKSQAMTRMKSALSFRRLRKLFEAIGRLCQAKQRHCLRRPFLLAFLAKVVAYEGKRARSAVQCTVIDMRIYTNQPATQLYDLDQSLGARRSNRRPAREQPDNLGPSA